MTEKKLIRNLPVLHYANTPSRRKYSISQILIFTQGTLSRQSTYEKTLGAYRPNMKLKAEKLTSTEK